MNYSIRTRLLAILAFNLLLLGLLGLFSIHQMGIMNDKASLINRRSIPAVRNAEAIEYHLTRYRLLQSEYIFNVSAGDRQRIENGLRDLQAEIERLLLVHDTLIESDEERATLEKMRSLWDEFVDLTYQKFLPAAEISSTGSVNPAFGRLAPLYQELIRTAQELLQHKQQQALNATLEAQATSQSARQVVLGMTLFALLLSVALGFPLASYIVTNLGRLISTTVAVAGGDLQRRVELRSRDELGMLAEHFNLMVSNLQQHQLLLEERNAALEASLFQQQQLMDDLIRGKRAEEAAYRAQAAAEAANRAKSEFLSRMSHELRTPMNAILGYAQLLQMQGLTPQQQKSVSSILKSGRHLLNLINEVLDIARIEAGHLPMSLEPVYLPALIDDVLDVISPLADQRRIHIENIITEQGDRFVLADYQRLKQILLNLLSNAVKYNTEAGFVHLAYTEDAQGRLKVMVRDTGPGIASDEIGLLFTPFTRVGMESASIEGIGLGLALSKKMVEAMGGEIGVESELGRGSTFWIALNIAQPPVIESQDGAQSSTPVQSALPQTGTGVVLYIEDNIANVKLIEEVLVMRPGVRLLTAMQARLGVDLAFEHQPDLILLDLNLPDMDGEETLRQLRAHPKTREIPVVMMSADATRGRVERLLAAGANHYLTKPIHMPELLRLIDETLQIGV